jgi:hypothetical protein
MHMVLPCYKLWVLIYIFFEDKLELGIEFA